MSFGLAAARPIKILINVGCCMDIPTGRFVKGKHGEHILNGGLANLWGITGLGNSFKSTFMHFMMMTAMARMNQSYGMIYDTEMNIFDYRIRDLYTNAYKYSDIPMEDDWIDSGRLVITDKSVYSGNKWYDNTREHMKERIKDKKGMVATPFITRKGEVIKMHRPATSEMDSFTEFTTDMMEKMQNEAEIGESGQNAISLKSGQHKNQLLMELPSISVASDTYFLLSAHLGDEFNLDPRKLATKKLADLPQGLKLKGVPEKFTFVTHNCWLNSSSVPLLNDGTKEPEFPRDDEDDRKRDTDLRRVTTRGLRGKSGLTGEAVILVVSQTLGILPSLTEFYNIKENGRFGIEGNNVTYHLDLLPTVSVTRKSVRRTIEGSRRFRRALNITSEMQQMQEYWFHQPEVMMSTKDVYQKVKEAGYDWDMILSKTRGWWALEDDDRPIGLFLSSYDILMMAQGKYHPYWLEADKKTIKKEYRHFIPAEEDDVAVKKPKKEVVEEKEAA